MFWLIFSLRVANKHWNKWMHGYATKAHALVQANPWAGYYLPHPSHSRIFPCYLIYLNCPFLRKIVFTFVLKCNYVATISHCKYIVAHVPLLSVHGELGFDELVLLAKFRNFCLIFSLHKSIELGPCLNIHLKEIVELEFLKALWKVSFLWPFSMAWR